jgi:hypothetical protein
MAKLGASSLPVPSPEVVVYAIKKSLNLRRLVLNRGQYVRVSFKRDEILACYRVAALSSLRIAVLREKDHECRHCLRLGLQAVYMDVRHVNGAWICRYYENGNREKLLRQTTFARPEKLIVTVKRGKGMTFELATRSRYQRCDSGALKHLPGSWKSCPT